MGYNSLNGAPAPRRSEREEKRQSQKTPGERMIVATGELYDDWFKFCDTPAAAQSSCDETSFG